MGKPKFEVFDIVVSKRAGYNKFPMVILGYRIFPDGKPAYRMRDVLPMVCLVNSDELWPENDAYHSVEFVDERFVKLWSYPK